ncbi:MAG: excalibur calcium-binding domain-containing protein [Sphingomicrobium sp.]
MRLLSVFVLLASPFVAVSASSPTSAHPGGLDANGCHHNRKTGDNHCHRKAASIAHSGSRGVASSHSNRPFANCAEARAAGAAPVRAGDPGYSLKLDRDRDGVGCE